MNSMQNQHVENLARQLVDGAISLDRFLSELARPKTADLGDTQLDLDRRRRCGYPEVVYGEGKTVAQIEKIFERMLAEKIEVFATRISPDVATSLVAKFPTARYNAMARTLRIEQARNTNVSPTNGSQRKARAAIVTAGTSDIPVAEEARETLAWMGVEATMIHDVGVAGPHRLPERLHLIADADVVVVVAGMEGALPSVVGGYVACPVIGVPTSVGYGASCGGLAALFSMLNSCASNVTVVNVDAGFKGGYVAGLIAQRAAAQHA
jgi:pyridinium-3,5-biscarboxylic acid mononucleotide synthase